MESVERIETTVGELVCAITDAAEEIQVNDQELERLTHLVLMQLLRRFQQ
jgi:hypothetical protein